MFGLLASMTAAAGAGPGTGGPAAVLDATVGPLESGRSAYVGGTYAWTDYAYDDTGANTSAGSPGAATYPDPKDQSNAADLVQLQAQLDEAGDLAFTAVLETLTRADEPLLGVGLDTDGSSSTGAASLPGWTAAGKLGLDLLLTASSDGGRLSRWTGSAWAPVAALSARVDVRDNTVRVTLPASAVPAGRSLRTVAAVGLRRAEASWLTGKGPIFDLAFVRGEEPTSGGSMLASATQVAVTGQGHATGGQWQDRHQADVLAGHLPAAGAVASIDLDALREGRTTIPSRQVAGYHTMLYHSDVALPEGIVDGTAAGGLWAGPFQPYLVQLPPHPTAGLPVLMYLHGGGAGHLNNGLFAPQGPMTIGRSLAVFPWTRETTTANDHGYQGVNEQDVLDVLTSVRREYATDPQRTVVIGVSTGGAGALRMAMLHPDLFSAVLAMSAYDDTHVLENLIDLPLVMHNGMADPAASQATLALTLTELDNMGDVGYRSYSVGAHSHADPAAPVSQCLLDGLLHKRVVRDPARVVLGLDPGNDPAALPPGVRLRHGDAYWLGDVHVQPGTPAAPPTTPFGNVPGYGASDVARVDVTSLGFAHRTPAATKVEGAGQNLTAGATLCGPDPETQSNEVWRVHGIDVAAGLARATSNAATLALRKVADLTLDLPRMRLSTRTPLTITATGDGRTTLRLRGPWTGPVQVSVDGGPSRPTRPAGGLLSLPLDLSGSHTITVRPAAG